MFTSKEHLHQNLGVDARIAKFFVDRKVPENNSYWKGRYLYVAKGTGFLFIPLYFDLQYKCGVEIDTVLNEVYVQVVELILHSAALHESEEITFLQHLNNCKEVMTGHINNPGLYDNLLAYFNNDLLRPYKNLGTESKALNRGDTLLFSLCYLKLDQDIIDNIIQNWYALVPSFLLMDDVVDLQEDKEKSEENSVNDFGKGSKGIQNAIEFLREKFNELKVYNDKLGLYFEKSLERKISTPYLQSLLNQN